MTMETRSPVGYLGQFIVLLWAHSTWKVDVGLAKWAKQTWGLKWWFSDLGPDLFKFQFFGWPTPDWTTPLMHTEIWYYPLIAFPYPCLNELSHVYRYLKSMTLATLSLSLSLWLKKKTYGTIPHSWLMTVLIMSFICVSETLKYTGILSQSNYLRQCLGTTEGKLEWKSKCKYHKRQFKQQSYEYFNF